MNGNWKLQIRLTESERAKIEAIKRDFPGQPLSDKCRSLLLRLADTNPEPCQHHRPRP